MTRKRKRRSSSIEVGNGPRLTTHHGSKDNEQHQYPAHGRSMQTA